METNVNQLPPKQLDFWQTEASFGARRAPASSKPFAL